MKVRETIEGVYKWAEQKGVQSLQLSGAPDLRFIANLDSDQLEGMTFQELDETLLKISSYKIYLVAQIGEMQSRLSVLRSDFNQRLNSRTEKLIGKFRTYPERRALVLRTNGRLKDRSEKLAELEAKLEMVKDLPRAIEDKISLMKRLYNRRLDEERS